MINARVCGAVRGLVWRFKRKRTLCHCEMAFTTKDQDNDTRDSNNCATQYNLNSAWWYANCYQADLNGQYLGGAHEQAWPGIICVAYTTHWYI